MHMPPPPPNAEILQGRRNSSDMKHTGEIRVVLFKSKINRLYIVDISFFPRVCHVFLLALFLYGYHARMYATSLTS